MDSAEAQITPAPKGAADRLELPFPAPVAFAGETYDKIVLREPTAGEILAVRQAPMLDREILLIHRVAGVPKGVIQQLGAGLAARADTWLWRWVNDDGLTADDQERPLVIPLRKALQSGEQSISSLSLREPTSGEMREIRARDLLEQPIAAIALIGGIPEEAVRKIGIRDVVRAEAYLVGFIDAGRKAGGA